MKIYAGRCHKGECQVYVVANGSSRRLNARRDLINHSPDGFEWGYPGSGPSQLALAMVADALNNDRLAVQLHQGFKTKVVAYLARGKGWEMKQSAVLRIAADVALESSLRLMQVGRRVEVICSDCGLFLRGNRMMVENNGILEIAAGWTMAEVRAAAREHHGDQP